MLEEHLGLPILVAHVRSAKSPIRIIVRISRDVSEGFLCRTFRWAVSQCAMCTFSIVCHPYQNLKTTSHTQAKPQKNPLVNWKRHIGQDMFRNVAYIRTKWLSALPIHTLRFNAAVTCVQHAPTSSFSLPLAHSRDNSSVTLVYS